MARLRLNSPQDAVAYLYAQINYERSNSVPYRSRQFRFARLEALLQALGNPHHHVPAVHVAGTKGKGSTCAMLDAVLSRAGLRVGRFTSPHLNDLGERLVVAGRPCPPQRLLELVRQVAPVAEHLKRHPLPQQPGGPTFFELMTALGFLHFHQEEVDLAVVEVGLGGRLDSTNVCRPRLCIITSISFDHMACLGNTLPEIAAEKAGIIKPGVPVLSGVQQPEAAKVIRRRAAELSAPLWELGRHFCGDPLGSHLGENAWRTLMRFRGLAPPWQELEFQARLPLVGNHQVQNASLAAAAAWLLRRQGEAVSVPAIIHGLENVQWPARMELISVRPLVVLDAAHNVASAQALADTLAPLAPAGKRWLLFATSADKDIDGMARVLAGAFDRVMVTRFGSNPRAADPARVAHSFTEAGGTVEQIEPAPQALRYALEQLGAEDLLCVCGSLFLAAELRPRLLAWAAARRRVAEPCNPTPTL